MYTRTYSDDARSILIPESYGGTTLKDGVFTEADEREKRSQNPWEGERESVTEEPNSEESEQVSASPSKWQFPPFFANIFKNSNFSLQKIGTEEILLITAAAFLFFSKDGDKECAIMLLLLLFLG